MHALESMVMGILHVVKRVHDHVKIQLNIFFVRIKKFSREVELVISTKKKKVELAN